MKKIIQILCHTLQNDEQLEYHIYGNWCSRQAKSIQKYSDAYSCEVWYAVNGLSVKKSFKKDGILFKLYPAKTLNKLLESFFAIVDAPELINDIANEDPKSTVINFQGERGSLLHKIVRKYPNYIYSIQYHGYGQPPMLDWIENFFLVPYERKTFQHISHFFIHIKRRYKYLVETIGIQKNKISFQNYGVDYNRFKPGSKKDARKKLDIPQNKFVMLYVGIMTKTKGVDRIIEAYEILKKQYPELYLILIGAHETDPLWKLVKAKADVVLGTVNNEDLPVYYHAADVYCFYGTRKTIEYAGTGTAPVEAIVSNINVVSTNLIHYPSEIMKKTGFIPKNFNDFVSKIEYCIQNPKFKFNARDIVKKYSSEEFKTKNMLKIYDNLLNRKHSA